MGSLETMGTRRGPRRFSRWLVLGGVGAVVLVGAALLGLRARSPAIEPVQAPARAKGRKSIWAIARPAPGASARAPARPGTPPVGAALQVQVDDVTGGPIEGARIKIGGTEVGTTDGSGLWWVGPPAAGIPEAGKLEATADGYAPGSAAYARPGRVRLKLLPGSQVAGLVVEAVTGRPVGGVTVSDEQRSTVSDQEGHFAFRDLPAGILRLQARGPRHHGTLDPPISVGLGRVDADVRIEVRPAFAIRGHVLAGGRPPASRIEVEGADGVAPVGSDGRYELLGVVPGVHEIGVRARESSSFYLLGSVRQVKVVDTDVTADIDLGTRHSITVETADHQGRPLADVVVLAAHGNEELRMKVSCKTDIGGRCVFEGLPGKSAEVSTSAGLRPSVEVELPASAPVRFVLDAGGRIEGRLACADGRPPRSRHLFLINSRSEVRASVPSAADGRFSFTQLAPDRYKIEVREHTFFGPDYGAEARQDVTISDEQPRVEVVIPLPAEDGRISGRVVDGAGRPVPDVLISHQVSYTNLSRQKGFAPGADPTVTDEAGEFAIEGLPRFYRYTVQAYRVTGEQAVTRDVSPDGKPLTLQLQPIADEPGSTKSPPPGRREGARPM